MNGADATLKRIYREADGRIRLQPANSSMQPGILVPADNQVEGRVLAVLRKYK